MQTEGNFVRLDEDDCPTKTHGRNLVCNECGRTFQTPILASVSISGQTQTYNACPRCMTQASSPKTSAQEKGEKEPVPTAESRKPTAEQERVVNCKHFFGFLNKHQKNMPFPDECLTCAKMVECILHH